MKNSMKPSSKKGKGAAVSLVICFVAMIAIVGAVTFSRYQNRYNGEELAKLEETTDTKDNFGEATTEPTNSQAVENENTKTTEEKKENESESENKNEQNSSHNANAENVTEKEDASQEKSSSSATSGNPAALAFSENDLLIWPVAEGNVLMNYSMDKTVYFSTLDQYKYNPAVIISGEVGKEVVAAARGIVKSIEVNAQTGTTVTMDLGNGYEAVYGQLKEVPVQEGKYVEQGALVGYLSEPTKYYSVEGCNLYFQLQKDGKPVNPMEYFDA